MSISVHHITKTFGRFTALDNLSLEVPSGSLLALLGPSGSGKTTLLRILAGLESADQGRVFCDGVDITRSNARDRNMGFVFQHYALFRHMSVFENVAFGLHVRKTPRQEVADRVHELLKLVRLENLEKRYPSQLSGGQRQRVALARALAIRPKVLLLDEPFGALDAKVRAELRSWIRRLHDEIQMTSVFVTHDQEEAFEVADQVVVMNRGRIEQAGPPGEVFEHPATPFVIDFLGNVNVFHGRVRNGRAMLGALELDYPEYPHAHEQEATFYVRPHELDVHRSRNGVPALAARVQRVNAAGSLAKVALVNEEFGIDLNVELSLDRFSELNLRRGETVFVSPRKARAFMPEYVI
jgi:sulfate transport system ATP-binding protein